MEDFDLFIETMLLHCLQCRKNNKSKNPKVVKTKNKK